MQKYEKYLKACANFLHTLSENSLYFCNVIFRSEMTTRKQSIHQKTFIMTFLKIYLIGVAVAFLIIAAMDYFYYYDRQIKYISFREIVQDTLSSLLSWLVIPITLYLLWFDWFTGIGGKGSDLRKKLEARKGENRE